MKTSYVVTHREVLITRYLVTGVEDEDDAADCIRGGELNVVKLDTDMDTMPEGDDDWEFKEMYK